MICSNIGSRKDRLITEPWKLRRKWVLRRFVGIAFEDPKNKKRCHMSQRHGPKANIHRQHMRALGKDPEFKQNGFVSYFHSEDLMWKATQEFLLKNEGELLRLAQLIDQDPRRPKEFEGTIEMNEVLGEGLARFKTFFKGPVSRYSVTTGDKADPAKYDTAVRRFTGLRSARFTLEYEQGTWYLIRGYPDVAKARDEFLKATSSGSTIEL